MLARRIRPSRDSDSLENPVNRVASEGSGTARKPCQELSKPVTKEERAMARGRRNTADEQLLMALACGATVEAAARAAHVSVSTAYRRLREPAFCQRLQQ